MFKTLGFGGWHIAGLIFGESLFIASIGCTIGIVCTFPIAKVFGNTMGTYFPVFHVAMATICLDVAAALLVGAVAAIIPTWRAINVRIADGLRRIG